MHYKTVLNQVITHVIHEGIIELHILFNKTTNRGSVNDSLEKTRLTAFIGACSYIERFVKNFRRSYNKTDIYANRYLKKTFI